MANKKSKPAAKISSQTKGTPDAGSFFLRKRLHYLILFFLAFALYANTLSHEFILDDKMVVTANQFTKRGLAGWGDIFSTDAFYGFYGKNIEHVQVTGGRYRPLSIALFALVWQFAGESSLAFHLMTVLLFGLTCILAYSAAHSLLKVKFGNEKAGMLALAAGLLFAAHPVHTEVVNNVKCVDELLCLLLSLLALQMSLRAFDAGRKGLAWAAGGVFFLACLAKENAVAFVAVIPLALLFFRERKGDFRNRLVQVSVPIWIFFLVFFVLRGTILGWKFGAAPMELINNPFIKFENGQWVHYSGGEKFASLIYILGKYLWLLLFPHPLSSDYYPRQIPILNFANPWVWISLTVYTFITLYAVGGFLKGKKDPLRFGALFFLLTIFLVSNILFPIGTNLAERFLFMPSFGFCLASAFVLFEWLPGKMPLKFAVLGFILLLYSGKTLSRNPDYASNLKLFLEDVKTSPNSAKLRGGCGTLLCQQAMSEKDPAKKVSLLHDAIAHLDRAIEIHPTYLEAHQMRGNAYFLLADFEAAVRDYRVSYRLNPAMPNLATNLALALREAAKKMIQQNEHPDKVIQYLLESNKIYGKDTETMRLLASAYAALGNQAEAAKWEQLAAQTQGK
jgi:tetratricopeptide (TPR) repeat protein